MVLLDWLESPFINGNWFIKSNFDIVKILEEKKELLYFIHKYMQLCTCLDISAQPVWWCCFRAPKTNFVHLAILAYYLYNEMIQADPTLLSFFSTHPFSIGTFIFLILVSITVILKFDIFQIKKNIDNFVWNRSFHLILRKTNSFIYHHVFGLILIWFLQWTTFKVLCCTNSSCIWIFA